MPCGLGVGETDLVLVAGVGCGPARPTQLPMHPSPRPVAEYWRISTTLLVGRIALTLGKRLTGLTGPLGAWVSRWVCRAAAGAGNIRRHCRSVQRGTAAGAGPLVQGGPYPCRGGSDAAAS